MKHFFQHLILRILTYNDILQFFQSKMDYDVCVIFKEEIIDEIGSHVTLTEKGAIGVCNASKERHDDLVVTAGEKVHKSCRDSYINKKNIKSYNKKKESTSYAGSPVKRRLRTDHEFDYG